MEKIESPVGANDLQSVLLEIPEPVGAAANRQDDRVETEESQGAVRLRQPQRHQMEMRVRGTENEFKEALNRRTIFKRAQRVPGRA